MNSVRHIRGLSVAQIDQFSEALGSIKSLVSTIVDDNKDTRNILAVINDKVSALSTDAILEKSKSEALHKRLDRIEPIVDDHEDKFKFAAWLVAGITAFITFLINVVPAFLGKLFP